MPAAPSAVEILDRLIAFDTVSARSNLALIDWVADYLDGHGIGVRLTRSDDGAKANLWATVGPDDRGGVVLSGHTDVVPVEEQPWTSDPFVMTDRGDGRLYGRGTADMKAFLALCLAKVPEWRARGLRTPLHLAFSYDEEMGCLGVGRLIDDVTANLPKPRLAVVGEPTEMRVVNAHKGGCGFRCRIVGHAAHASSPQLGLNAVFHAADAVRFIAALAEEFRAVPEPDSGFTPPYTTFNVGRIDGGVASNVVAPSCEFLWEFRAMPGTDPDAIAARVEGFLRDELIPRLRASSPPGHAEMERLFRIVPLVPDPEGEAETLVRRLTGANGQAVVSFGTEAGLFQAAGIPAVVCGPGSIDQAHQPDEWIARDQMDKGARFLDDLAAWAAAE